MAWSVVAVYTPSEGAERSCRHDRREVTPMFTRLRTIQVGFTQISHDGPIRARALSSRRIVPATSDATPADMLSRLPVMEPIDWQAEPPSTSTCDAAEPDLKRPKRSEDQRALEVFQEV